MLGPASHPSAAKPKHMMPMEMKGSSGNMLATESARPNAIHSAPAEPAAAVPSALHSSCRRRRCLRSVKKVFQSSGGDVACAVCEAEAAAAAAASWSCADVEAGRRVVLGVVRAWAWARRRFSLGLGELSSERGAGEGFVDEFLDWLLSVKIGKGVGARLEVGHAVVRSRTGCMLQARNGVARSMMVVIVTIGGLEVKELSGGRPAQPTMGEVRPALVPNSENGFPFLSS
jgi:hypothetical protein